MTRHLSIILLVLFLFTPYAQIHAAEVITNDTVVQLVEAGLSNELIIAKIQNSESDFSVEITDILLLKETGLPDDIITAMIESQGQHSLDLELPATLDYDDISLLIQEHKFQEAYTNLNEFKQAEPTNRKNDLVELEIMVAEAAFSIKNNTPDRKVKTKTAGVKLKTIYRAYYTDTSYWMSYAHYYWMLGRERGTLKCLKKVHYYDPGHLTGLILKGDAIMKSIEDSPRSDEDSDAMLRDSMMDKGREAYKAAIHSPKITDMQKAEIRYKLGVYEEVIFKNKRKANKHWHTVIEISADSQWAILAQEKLGIKNNNGS